MRDEFDHLIVYFMDNVCAIIGGLIMFESVHEVMDVLVYALNEIRRRKKGA